MEEKLNWRNIVNTAITAVQKELARYLKDLGVN